MKLNLDYYKSDLLYDKTVTLEEEKNILDYINNYDEKRYYEIFENDTSVSVVSALSNNANNSINWYDFASTSTILQINSGFGEITGELCTKLKKVVVVEPNKARAEAIAKRYNDRENLEIICANIEDIKVEQKFDYIVLYGAIENANKLLNDKKEDKNSAETLIKLANSLLKENGHILILTNNKFGARKFTGVTDNIDEKPYDSIIGNCNLYSKYELENIFKNLGLNNYKFYYMLPDYKLTNVIYSDDYMPKENDSKIIYNKYCNERSIFAFDEVNLLKEIVKNNKFDFFCNSFFIDISINNENVKEVNNNPKFISFNNMRNEEFKHITKMYDDVVIKESKSDISIEHINQIHRNIDILTKHGFNLIDSYKDNKIYSKFMNYETFDKTLLNLINTKGIQEFYNSIETWYEYIKNKLKPISYNHSFTGSIFCKDNIQASEELLNKMLFVKDGFIDLVFENTFLVEKEFIFYDQEWYFENVPIDFILYRALNNMFSYNKSLENILNKDEIFEHFGIHEYIALFASFEKVFQDYAINENAFKIYSNVYERNLENHIFNIKDDIHNEHREFESKLEKTNLEYKNEITKLESEISDIYNSKCWKYTKIFRKKK